MPSLTERDKRTLRLAAMAIAIYLVLFFGWRGWARLEAKRHEYQRLVKEALRLKQELRPYENKVLLLEKLKETFRFDPPKLSKASVVAEASAAFRAAQAGGIELGPIRESSARTAARLARSNRGVNLFLRQCHGCIAWRPLASAYTRLGSDNSRSGQTGNGQDGPDGRDFGFRTVEKRGAAQCLNVSIRF